MGVKRYVASKDTTITNAFKENLVTRATGSNMGASDSMEVFSIYAQATTSSVELSRILVQFPIDQISESRTNGKIPVSGSVSFYLHLSNATHPLTLPKDFYLTVQAVSKSWNEGSGLDMEQYKDVGYANWISASSTTAWDTEGGDYHSSPTFTQYFDTGVEDLHVDVTPLVEEWLAGTKDNYGFGIQLSSSLEAETRSYYTKKFFTRGSEFFFKKPYIEARWNSAISDDRENFYVSSSLLPAEENLHNLYFYNRFKGRLVNIPSVGTGSIYVSVYSGSTAPVGSALTLHNGSTVVTGSYVSAGLYSASLAIYTTSSLLFDVWHNNLTGSGREEYFTGSFYVYNYDGLDDYQITDYILNINNLKATYSHDEVARFRVLIRDKDWQPNVYTVATSDITPEPIDSAYYKIYRIQDNYEIIPYGTGSDSHTLLSYDKEGNYFDLDMKILEKGYSYGIKILISQDGEYREQRELFKFRVE